MYEFSPTNMRVRAPTPTSLKSNLAMPSLHFLQNVAPPLKGQENFSLVKTKNAELVPATMGPWLIRHRDSAQYRVLLNAVRNIPGIGKIGPICYLAGSWAFCR